MPLRFRDIDGLRERLLEAGQEAVGDEATWLAGVTAWYDAQDAQDCVLDGQTFAHLCQVARSSADATARQLALGALITLQGEPVGHLARGRFIAMYAIRQICALTQQPGWSGLQIPDVEASEAKELLEMAQTDSGHTEAEVLARTEDFIVRHQSAGDSFGRFAQNLEILLDVIRNPTSEKTHRDMARRALVYFDKADDAISDELGLVGLLDDALIVRLTVERIRPRRAAISAYLDGIARDWPFVRNLELEADGEVHRLSELLIINLGFVLPSPEGNPDDTRGVVVVISDLNPALPFLVGFLRAIAAARDFARDTSRPTFERDERLAEQETGGEVFFEDYGRLRGTTFEPCEPEDATHFRVRQPVRGRAGDMARRIKPIEALRSLRRSSRQSKRLRRGVAGLEFGEAPVGPLERTFGSVVPIVFPSERGVVIVVAPFKASETLARILTLYGKSISDVLPMGQSSIDEDDKMASSLWTRVGPGGDPLLTVVRSSSEAVELSENFDRSVLAVVGVIRPGQADASNFKRLAASGIPVLAVVDSLDDESQKTFQRAAFKFWAWDEKWLGHLRWPRREPEEPGHPVAAFEHRLQKQLSTKVEVVGLDNQDLDTANQALRRLDRCRRENNDDDPVLGDTVEAGFSLLVALCRSCVGPGEHTAQMLDTFRTKVRSGEWWSNDIQKAAEAAVDSLERALKALRDGNPKHELLKSWIARNPTGAVFARPRERDAGARFEDLSTANWVQGRRTLVDVPLLILGWMGRPGMERLLAPPVAPSTTLALYGPERDWYESFRSRQERAKDFVTTLVEHHSPIPLPTGNVPAVQAQVFQPEELVVDDIVNSVRRGRSLRGLESADEEAEVDARLVYFTSGHWAAFGLKHTVHTVTHLVGADEGDGKERLEEISASELRAGAWVLIVRGSDRDVLRHAADRELPPGLRETAALWRTALQRFLEKGPRGNSRAELRRRLEQEGCHRIPATVRGWLDNDRMIGPKDHEHTIEAIQRATGDSELQRRLRACKEAVSAIRSTHFAVAHRLAKQVLARVTEWLDIETPAQQLVEVEERVVLLYVDAVDPQLATVPQSAINHLREPTL